jgi:hypothetical protein
MGILGQMATAGAGAIIGHFTANQAKDLARENTRDYMEWQQQHAKDMAKFNREQQMQLWEDTNFKAQMDQLKKAGLNPALMYKQGGAGGTTQLSGGGGASGTGGANVQQAQGMGMEIGQAMMMKKQMELIDAEVRLKDAQANKTSGVDTKLGETQISNLLQGIKNQQAQEIGQKLDNIFNETRNFEQNETQEDRLSQVNYLTKQAKVQLGLLENQKEISDETKETIIEQTKRNLINAQLQSVLLVTQNEKLEKDIEMLSNKITVDNAEIMIKEFMAEHQAEYPNIMNVGGSLIARLTRGLDNINSMIFNRKTEKYNPKVNTNVKTE